MRLTTAYPIKTAGGGLALVLTIATAVAAVQTTDLKFRPSQFRTESAVAAWDTGAKAGTVPRSARTRGTVPVFAGSIPRYQVVLGEGMDVTDEPGAPQLPVKPVVIALEGHQVVTSVTFEVGEWKALAGKHTVLPAQQQEVLMAGTNLGPKPKGISQKPKAKAEEGFSFTGPKQSIYGSAEPYPATVVRLTGTSYRNDSTFVQALVYPVRYIGAERRLEVCSEVKVKVEVEGRAKAEARGQKLEARMADAGSGFEYVIVTGQGLDTVFQRLADWKTLKGVPAVVRTMDWVCANYMGRDHAEQLRNYLKTLPDSGVRYVLLGGDVDVVPFRKAYAMSSEWGADPREDSLPCDLYFADLQGTWDANNNSVFGEVADSVDLYADLAVGRAPANDVAQAQTFVRKVLDYEHAAVPGYQNKDLFFAEILWQDPYTDMGVHKDRIEQQSFASGYSLTKLYQSLGNETRVAVMQAMRENQNFLNHDGHGWTNVMECGGSANRMFTADADTITNAGLGVLYSIGCWTTAFDFTSIGEAFVTNPNGGTVATIGNSSYGWGSPGNPGFGYSDKFDNHFWHAVTSEGIYRVGDALVAAKEYYAPFSRGENVYRWHQYDVNLMGDPEMPVWTALPRHLDLTGPTGVGIGPGRYEFWVTSSGAPVAGALICMTKPGEVYSRGRTDDAGRVWLDAEPKTPGRLEIVITAQNFVPHTSSIGCENGDYVDLVNLRIDDSAGNGDGVVNPGETLALSFDLKNTGNNTSCPVFIRMSAVDARVAQLDSEANVPEIVPGESVAVDSGFRLVVAAAANEGEALKLRFDLFGCYVVRTYTPVLQVGEPALGLERASLRRTLLPGATSGLEVRLQNRGHGYGHGTWCRLVSLDGYITVDSDSAAFGEVLPLSDAGTDRFAVSASASCPNGHVARMELQVNADGFTGSDTFELLVGESGFTDDMESGEAKWSHGGTGDLWHRTSYRTHSGAYSWYCGDDSTHTYHNGMDAGLLTVPFAVPEGCTLRFWRWFRTPNYGVDGIRVIVLRGAAEETLDFLGTGGALGRKWSSCPVSQWSSQGTESEATKARRTRNGRQPSEEPEPGIPGTRSLDHLTARPLRGKWSSEGTESEATKARRTRNGWRPSGEPESGIPGTRLLDHLTTRPLLNQSGWAEETYDLSWLGLGETVQVKLAFVSDRDTVDEGFYIDDVSVTGGGPPGVQGVKAAAGLFPSLDVWPNPFRSLVQIRYGVAGELPHLSIYDAAGQLVRRLPTARVTAWDGSDQHGRRLPAGAYFIEARTQSERSLAKVLLAR